ncbi:TBC-domain-containing protein [Mytilinidion resinicola]|uniref:TBC-domain-containing protein n=1 Tax=Mytilinidion resinicola TaxID=574789 RepID=A0A6A6YKR3_9PEZI|nr:TBC-domain-containing protein [Mytilinidion resinicola]KAF2808467.1 TBC-domain-containing protein [Mytilinidion resinicola]
MYPRWMVNSGGARPMRGAGQAWNTARVYELGDAHCYSISSCNNAPFPSRPPLATITAYADAPFATLPRRPRMRQLLLRCLGAVLRTPSTSTDAKSLTSFPSLSPTPDASPVQNRVNGWFRAAVGESGTKAAAGGNKTRTADTGDKLAAAEVGSEPAPDTIRKASKTVQSIVGTLVAASPSTRSRTALFDDTPQEPDKVPGSLHHASDKSVELTLERVGPVKLVRQLAGDLAQRDAQVTALRRRAEERERILRKMLQECEVSNMDIESRLRELDRSQEQRNDDPRARNRRSDSGLPGTHPDDPMEQRIARAMADNVSDFDTTSIQDNASMFSQRLADGETESLNSISEMPKDPARNWKNFLWSGTNSKTSRAPSITSKLGNDTDFQTRSRASSNSKLPRKPISGNLFVPPSNGDKQGGAIPTLRRLQSQDEEQSTSSSRRSSVSVTNWVLQAVAGKNQVSRPGDKQGTLRGRAATSASGSTADRAPSKESTRTSQSTGPANASAKANGRPRAARSSLGPNGTIKSIPPESVTSPNGLNRNISNLGPVEMDTILPEDSRPPTLVQQHNNFSQSSEYLTDRFGFIYDQRRKKRQSEAAAAMAKHKRSSNVESLSDARSVLKTIGQDPDVKTPPTEAPPDSGPASRPGSTGSSIEEQNGPQAPSRWQDFLKLATFPTELLSHTPSAAPITTVDAAGADPAPKVPPVVVAKSRTMPLVSVNPEPAPSRIVSGNAEFATTSPSISVGPASPIRPPQHQPDPVKALLEQLTDLHDSLQRDKTVKWNDFLRKVRAERKREGEAATVGEGRPRNLTMPEALLGDGELIGVAGLGNKGKTGRAKWQEFKQLVLGGIPVAYRAKIWAECSGASALRVPGYYDDLVNNGVDNPSIVAQIQMDINRTLTDNIFFRKGPGVHKLNEVLIAYSRRNPEVGYCQGMNLITACLLLIMPTAEDAFWVLTNMIENILPEKYYDQQLLTSRADQTVLREYVVELLPKLSAHLDELEIELEALTFQWFLSVFTDCLSAEALFRVWDVVLCMHDGSTFLFQVALALLKLNEKALRECDSPARVYHYINHQMTNHAISIDGLIQASDALKKVVKRKDVEERREKAVEREQEVMRQREEMRRERAQKAKAKASEEPTGLRPDAIPLENETDSRISREALLLRTPLSMASRADSEEDILSQSLEEL